MSSVDAHRPCYNYGRYLRQCVESVLLQAGVDVRVLVIDDASSDDSAEVARRLAGEDSRVTLIQHQVNRGHIATYNEGIEWISATYYLLLSADDYLLPGALERAAKVLDAQPEAGFVFGDVSILRDGEFVTNSEGGDASRRQTMSCEEFIEFSGACNRVPTPTAVVRTALQKRLGGYRPELPHTGDMEMWLRLAAHSSVGYLQVRQAVQRQHSSNMSLNYFSAHWLPDLEQRETAINTFIENCGHTLKQPGKLRKRLLWLLALDAIGHASSAFNTREEELSEAISSFALGIAPSVWRSLSYLKLTLKRMLGHQAWVIIRPFITRSAR